MSRARLHPLHAACLIALGLLARFIDVHDITLNFSGTLSLGNGSFLAEPLQDYVDTTTLGIFGLIIALILVAVMLFVKRTRRRVAALEEALGPDGVLSVQETRLPAQTHREIVESINWLEEAYARIPSMDLESLISFEHEMRNSVALLNQAINRDALLETPDESSSKLKRALLIRTRLVLETVAKEITSRSR